MKFYEFITVTIIFVILLAGILVGGQINRKTDVQNTYNSGLIEEKRNEGISLDIQDEKVQKIYPFTGAFPTNELAYLSKLKNVNRENMTNEFILRTAFAKVTKDDWAASYEAEGEPVEIDAKVLDGYIKDIFGNIEYTHDDFSNFDLSVDGAVTSLYEAEYNEKTKTYTIEINEGDGVEDSYIDVHTIKATQHGDKIKIVINPIYLDNIGEKKNEDGEYAFNYKVYSSYDFKTKKFENELTGELDKIYNAYTINLEFVDEIKNINVEELESYIITYRLNGKTNTFEFESLEYEK